MDIDDWSLPIGPVMLYVIEGTFPEKPSEGWNKKSPLASTIKLPTPWMVKLLPVAYCVAPTSTDDISTLLPNAILLSSKLPFTSESRYPSTLSSSSSIKSSVIPKLPLSKFSTVKSPPPDKASEISKLLFWSSVNVTLVPAFWNWLSLITM